MNALKVQVQELTKVKNENQVLLTQIDKLVNKNKEWEVALENLKRKDEDNLKTIEELKKENEDKNNMMDELKKYDRLKNELEVLKRKHVDALREIDKLARFVNIFGNKNMLHIICSKFSRQINLFQRINTYQLKYLFEDVQYIGSLIEFKRLTLPWMDSTKKDIQFMPEFKKLPRVLGKN